MTRKDKISLTTWYAYILRQLNTFSTLRIISPAEFFKEIDIAPEIIRKNLESIVILYKNINTFCILETVSETTWQLIAVAKATHQGMTVVFYHLQDNSVVAFLQSCFFAHPYYSSRMTIISSSYKKSLLQFFTRGLVDLNCFWNIIPLYPQLPVDIPFNWDRHAAVKTFTKLFITQIPSTKEAITSGSNVSFRNQFLLKQTVCHFYDFAFIWDTTIQTKSKKIGKLFWKYSVCKLVAIDLAPVYVIHRRISKEYADKEEFELLLVLPTAKSYTKEIEQIIIQRWQQYEQQRQKCSTSSFRPGIALSFNLPDPTFWRELFVLMLRYDFKQLRKRRFNFSSK